MLSLENKQKKIIYLLYNYLKRPVIMKNQEFERPKKDNITDYPFIAYTITTHRVNDKGKGNFYKEKSNIDNTLISIKENQIKFTISFSSYDKDTFESKKLINKTIDFFEHIAYEELRLLDITVVSILNISSRDEFEVDSYEKINGFDIIFRTTNQIEKVIETIESNNILDNIKLKMKGE